MRPRLEHIMAMVWREENPNYIIILKNKAGKDMDFTQFKPVTNKNSDTEPKEKKKPARYVMTVTPYIGVLLLLRVVDTENANEEVFRVETSPKKREIWEKTARKQYRPLRYDS